MSNSEPRPRIDILPDDVINRIAAGEVVERPASVVKELIENALDAFAQHIQVHIIGGGVTEIRIIDDGIGMDEQNARTALLRHATSKIRSDLCLDQIETFGFRGEALPSIASVSTLRVETGTDLDRPGTMVRTTEQGVESSAAPPRRGTMVVIQDLFGAVPARRKFLKTERTEFNQIRRVVRQAALAHPAVGFQLEHNGARIMHLASGQDLEQRCRAIFPKAVGARLFFVQGQDRCKVEGWLAPPGDASTKATNLEIFVNKRPVHESNLRAAVRRAFGAYLEQGYTPVGVIYVTVRGEDVDVNVHPAKTQVRFSDPADVFRAVMNAVRATVARTPWMSISSPAVTPATTSEPTLFAPAPRRDVATFTPQTTIPTRPYFTEPPQAASTQTSKVFPEPAHQARPILRLTGARFLGQAARSYLLFQDDTRLLLADQHALHELTLFQNLQEAFHDTGVPVQPLLFPEELELTPERLEWALTNQGILLRLGFEIEAGGTDRLWVRAAPAMIRHLDVPTIIEGLLEILEDAPAKISEASVEQDLFRYLACQGAIKAGEHLPTEDAQDLVHSFERISRLPFLPHGALPVVALDYERLAALFKSPH